ncbi:MAG: TrkA C-terminal domain-containing protein [Desulfohalobiaceae bacterium]|nr:TrkA C-terminal domain-containing protein [Desulfohalobiaceae bacterium]
MIGLYTILFHWLMLLEGERYSCFNLLKPNDLQVLAEGLNLFRKTAPSLFVGKSLSECRIRKLTGCNLVAVNSRGTMHINPGPSYVFQPKDELFLVGSDQAQQEYLKLFSAKKSSQGHQLA